MNKIRAVPSVVRWLVPQRVIFIEAEPVFTAENAIRNDAAVGRLLQEAPAAPVHVITDKTGSRLNFRTQLAYSLKTHRHPMLGYVIMVGVDASAGRVLFNILAQVLRLNLRHARTLEDAFTLLETLDPTLPPLQAAYTSVSSAASAISAR